MLGCQFRFPDGVFHLNLRKRLIVPGWLTNLGGIRGQATRTPNFWAPGLAADQNLRERIAGDVDLFQGLTVNVAGDDVGMTLLSRTLSTRLTAAGVLLSTLHCAD